MKSITNLLKKAHLSPKERALLIIHDELHEMKHGTGILSEAQQNHIHQNWNPQTSSEANVYNDYMKVWNAWIALHTETQFETLKALYNLQRILTVLVGMLSSLSPKKGKSLFQNTWNNEGVSKQQALEYIYTHTGVQKEAVLHAITRSFLDDETHENLKCLDPNGMTEFWYMKEEYALYQAGDDSERMVEAFVNSVFWNEDIPITKRIHIMKDSYYAGYALNDFVQIIAQTHGVDSNDIEALATIENFQQAFTDAIRKAYADGYFEENPPLYKSTGTETYTEPTTKPHNETFQAWLSAYTHAQTQIANMKITDDDLVLGTELLSKNYEGQWIADYHEQSQNLLTLARIYLYLSQDTYMQATFQSVKQYKKTITMLSEYFEADMHDFAQGLVDLLTTKLDAIHSTVWLITGNDGFLETFNEIVLGVKKDAFLYTWDEVNAKEHGAHETFWGKVRRVKELME